MLLSPSPHCRRQSRTSTRAMPLTSDTSWPRSTAQASTSLRAEVDQLAQQLLRARGISSYARVAVSTVVPRKRTDGQEPADFGHLDEVRAQAAREVGLGADQRRGESITAPLAEGVTAASNAKTPQSSTRSLSNMATFNAKPNSSAIFGRCNLRAAH